MPAKSKSSGRLIALEGSRGRDLAAAARRLLPHFCGSKLRGGVSDWNASNIFFELSRGDPDLPPPSPRVLLLLYAADLAFRLRWEILPALEEGQCVIAAPYVETALAFGQAAGLPRSWLVELFRFAPRPRACHRLREPAEPPWPVRPCDGYLEFCALALARSPSRWNMVALRRGFLAYLDDLERRHRCRTISKHLPPVRR